MSSCVFCMLIHIKRGAKIVKKCDIRKKNRLKYSIFSKFFSNFVPKSQIST